MNLITGVMNLQEMLLNNQDKKQLEREDKMKIIGVTGSSGAGKSTICEIIEKKYNAEIIDADKVAKQLTKKDTLYLKAIVKYFGDEIINNKGELIRKIRRYYI